MNFDAIVSEILRFLVYIKALIAFLIAWLFSGFVYKRLLRARLPASPQVIRNLATLMRVIIILVGIFIALSILGIDVTGALVAAGFAGIVIGLAAQQTLGNLLAGITMLVEGRLKIGDMVRIGDNWGIIEHVGLLSTHVRLFSGEVLIIPNSSLFSSSIYNYSGLKARRIDLSVGISYGSDIGKAVKVIEEALWRNPNVLAEPQAIIIVDNLGDNSVNLKVMFWVLSARFLDARKSVLGEIKKALEEAGIEIPFPQRVVWLKEAPER